MVQGEGTIGRGWHERIDSLHVSIKPSRVIIIELCQPIHEMIANLIIKFGLAKHLGDTILKGDFLKCTLFVLSKDVTRNGMHMTIQRTFCRHRETYDSPPVRLRPREYTRTLLP